MRRLNVVLWTQALLIGAASTVGFAQPLWQSLNGPWRANDVRDIALSYRDTALHIYAANSGSHLVKSIDEGATWTHITQIQNPRVVACKPTNPDTVVAGLVSGLGQIWFSPDGGVSWPYTPISEPTLVPLRLVFAPADAQPNRVWLGTAPAVNTSSLRKSTNSGRDWSDDPFFHSSQRETHVTAILFHPTNANRIWVGGSQITTMTSMGAEYLAGVEGTEEMEAVVRGVWRSTNGGATWTSASLGGSNITALAASVDDDVHLFAGTSNPRRLYRSVNQGETWSEITAFPGTSATGAIYSIQVNPDDYEEIRVATDDGIYVSYARGINDPDEWELQADGLFDRTVKALAYDPKRPARAFVATPSGLYSTVAQHATRSTR